MAKSFLLCCLAGKATGRRLGGCMNIAMAALHR